MSSNNDKLLIDKFLPRYHFSEWHYTNVKAREEHVYSSLMTCDMGRSKVIRCLFRLRGLPKSKLHLERLSDIGFQILGSVPNREWVIGMVGRFWTRSAGIEKINPDDFLAFNDPAYAKAKANFTIEPLPNGSVRLATETRILCNSDANRNLFCAYWRVIRLFSGWIRHEMLRLIKHDSEKLSREKGLRAPRPTRYI